MAEISPAGVCVVGGGNEGRWWCRKAGKGVVEVVMVVAVVLEEGGVVRVGG